MDPNANLDEQLMLTKRITAIFDAVRPTGQFSNEQRSDLAASATRLAELVESLDHWITGGGFLPTRWKEVNRG